MKILAIDFRNNKYKNIYSINVNNIDIIEYDLGAQRINIYIHQKNVFHINSSHIPFIVTESYVLNEERRENTSNISDLYELYIKILDYCQFSSASRLTIIT